MTHAFLLFLLFITHLGSAENVPNPSNPTELTETAIKNLMKEHQIPGVAVALFYNEQPHLLNFGFADDQEKHPVTPDTIFEIGSVTKVFTSTAVAIEVLRNKMRLSDPVVKYLPGIKKRMKGIGKVTLAQLATHTSSLPRIPPPLPPHKGRQYNPTSLMQFLEGWEAPYPIGTHYLYSNLGFGILGDAVARVERRPYGEAIKHLILQPLEMRSTFVVVPHLLQSFYAYGYNKNGALAERYPLNAWPGGGALRSTSDDMLKFLMANLGIEGPIEILTAMQLAQKGIYKVNANLTMGLGWQRFNQEEVVFVDKNGGVEGFSSYIGFIPDKKIGIVLLANKGKAKLTKTGRQVLYDLAKQ
ncbi:MAG: serine hydrolase [Parachlamydia sp.]|nr:MAG: serine hydrolase [Parachlamydia sp.]